MLEVLDPEQNHAFSDHYLEVPFDLSKVMFIATANILDPVPPALRDRLEVLELPGYTREEKLNIAKQFLIPKQLEEHGLTDERWCSTTTARGRDHRQLHARGGRAQPRARDRQRHAARSPCWCAEGKTDEEGDRHPASIADYPRAAEVPARGRGAHRRGRAWPPASPGRRWAATSSSSRPRDARQGQPDADRPARRRDEGIGASGAVLHSLARRSGSGIDDELPRDAATSTCTFPAGAIPKDGPSAGVTMFASLVSLLTGKPVRSDVAMTGEITLRGLILPVGGIKEKVLAAHRAGIKRVIMPERNRKDVIDIPEQPKQELEIIYVKRMDELLPLVLTEMPELRGTMIGAVTPAPVVPPPPA